MGSLIGTTGLSVLATVAFVIGTILAMVADSRLRGLTGYNTNTTFQSAHNYIVIGVILGWVAAGIAFILLLGYLVNALAFLESEWVHMILWILAMAAAIISIIYLGLAMRKIDNTPNDNNTQGYLLWAMIVMGIGLVILTFLGVWRITHHATKTITKKIPAGDTYIVHPPASVDTTVPVDGTVQGSVAPPVQGHEAEVPY